MTAWKRVLWTSFVLLALAAIYYTITRGFTDDIVGNLLDTLVIVCLLLAIARTDTRVNTVEARLDAQEFGQEPTR